MFEAVSSTLSINALTIVSDTASKIKVPIGTKSVPEGISKKEYDIVIFHSKKEGSTWYAPIKTVRDYISNNSEKLNFYMDEEDYKTLCVDFKSVDIINFTEILRK